MFKNWYMERLDNYDRQAIRMAEDVVTVRETEKAVLLRFEGDKVTELWIPKSAIYTADEIAEKQKASEAKMNRYDALVSFGKANGLSFRTGLKVSTMMSKLRAAGLEYNY